MLNQICHDFLPNFEVTLSALGWQTNCLESCALQAASRDPFFLPLPFSGALLRFDDLVFFQSFEHVELPHPSAFCGIASTAHSLEEARDVVEDALLFLDSLLGSIVHDQAVDCHSSLEAWRSLTVADSRRHRLSPIRSSNPAHVNTRELTIQVVVVLQSLQLSGCSRV